MFFSSKIHFLVICLVMLLAACGNQESVESSTQNTPETIAQQATATPVSTETAVPPTPTETAVPTNTPIPTDTATATPVPTNTATPTPKPTDTPQPTDTPEPTDTPANTATPFPTVPPPTNTPAPVAAPVFPETPIRPFNADDFIRYLGLVRDSYRSFNSEMGLFQQTGKPGDCGTFIGWVRLWVLEAPGYTNVPSAWQPLYGEYRSMLQQIVTITTEIRPLCDGSSGGGTVSAETTQAIFNFLAWAYPRSEQMIIEAGQLPRP